MSELAEPLDMVAVGEWCSISRYLKRGERLVRTANVGRVPPAEIESRRRRAPQNNGSPTAVFLWGNDGWTGLAPTSPEMGDRNEGDEK